MKAPMAMLPGGHRSEGHTAVTVAVDSAAGDPGGTDRSVDAFRLAGANSGSEFISGLGGRAAITIGVLLLSLTAVATVSSSAVWPLPAAGVFALVAGVVLVRFPAALPLRAMDLLLVFTDCLLVLLGHYQSPLQPAIPGVYLIVGTILFAVRPWSIALTHVALLGTSYAGVLVVGPEQFAPVTRWLIVMAVIVTTGVFVRWLVATVSGLAVEEHTARDLAETATFELQQVSRAKSVFLARMSHELRTPLNVVLGFSDLLGEQLAGPLNTRQREYVADIADSARHLVALVDDVLDLAAVEAGGVRLNTGPLDIERVIDDSVIMVRDRAGAKLLRLTIDVPPSVGVIEADRLKIARWSSICSPMRSSSRRAAAR
jgi:signal transduction histidine kinase